MNVVVFGANGMLGRYVCSRLSQEHNVRGLTRKDFDPTLYDQAALVSVLENLLGEADIVINCLGVIKPRMDALGINAIFVNSIFPRILARVCTKKVIEMIHVSTDCVFDGFRSTSYDELDFSTALDLYGKTKSLGETVECCVVRTSIIGEEVGQARSLVEWAKSQKGQTVKGFVNHWWSGVTCLQLAELFSLMIKDKVRWPGVRHVFSAAVSKYELLKIISETYNLDLSVEQHISDTPCYRVMTTINSDWQQYLEKNIPDIKQQLVRMKEFTLV